jgi:membrane-bound ClpP family serine protease
MKLLKLLLALVALVFVVWGAFWLFGLVLGLFKWLFVFGVIALAGVGAYRLLAASDDESRPELRTAEAEMLKAERMLAEMRRKQLTK